METSTEISYDFSEDLAGERHIRALLGQRTMRPKVQLRTPEELLKPYTMPPQRDELIREDFPELAQNKAIRSGLAR